MPDTLATANFSRVYEDVPDVLTPAAYDDPFGLFRTDFVMPDGTLWPGYVAGLPGYKRNFSRDSYTASIIAGAGGMARDQLEIGGAYMGTKNDPITGEKPGKVHHEFPGVPLSHIADRESSDGTQLVTTYNACDTSAMHLIAAEMIVRAGIASSAEVVKRHGDQLKAAADYILSQTVDIGGAPLFWEMPPEGTDKYALRVTYWKDSIVVPHAATPDRLEPHYPVTYALAHTIAARGLLSAARLLGNTEYLRKADEMFRAGIAHFFKPDEFVIATDMEGDRTGASSDELHALAYLPVEYSGLLPRRSIVARARELHTPIGIASTSREIGERLVAAGDDYHGYVVWAHDQALVHVGAVKHGLEEPVAVARRYTQRARYVEDPGIGVELYDIGSSILPRGNPNQLWAAATNLYFAGDTKLRPEDWL